MAKKTVKIKLRSDHWFGSDAPVDLRAHHTGKLINSKLTLEELVGTDHPLKDRTISGRRPVIGVCKFGDDLNPCQAMHDHHLADRVVDGIRTAGGIPLTFSAAPPLGEPLTRPTSMYLRNLTALALLETLISNPLDGIVMLTGCDKTVPAGLMAALSADIPVIFASAGPMLNGYYRGQQTASGVHLWKNRELLAAGKITEGDLMSRSCAAQPSAGHCMSMGTASTMNSMAEALGLALPGSAAIPSPMAERAHASFRAGAVIVEMVLDDRRPRKFVKRKSFLNAVAINSAIGGSTNAVIHLLAAARMGGVDFGLADWDNVGADVPLLVNIKPAGEFLMEEYYRAGGLPAVQRELLAAKMIDGQTLICTGQTVADAIKVADPYVDRRVIKSVAEPLRAQKSIIVLTGNLAPDGAILKVSAVKNEELLQHRGQAVVFEDLEDYQKRIDDPKEKITPDNILVLKNCGPIGYPGMPEVGNIRVPGYLLKQGVQEMVTLSDARMSGTAYGCHILHISPESALGGPLAAVRSGDWITLDVRSRRLTLELSTAEIKKRLKSHPKPAPAHSPWGILQAHPNLGVHQAHVGAYLKLFDNPDVSPEKIAACLSAVPRRQH
jgi:L-arabonate dehydrase